jgi:farnesyl diphosphate synthase
MTRLRQARAENFSTFSKFLRGERCYHRAMSATSILLLRERSERALETLLPTGELAPSKLLEAMRYATLGGGKRMRPLLVYAAGCALGVPFDALDAPASAVEMIHAYSLIHDDLPAMDDDELRRGKPTCHIAYGEAIAILAGDALQALAFEVLGLALPLSEQAKSRMVLRLASACGPSGMAGGQAIDLASIGQSLGLAELDRMHAHKTGALITASVMLGADAAQCTDAGVLQALENYGRDFGLAFQIHDDVLDVEGETAVIGKPKGSDAARGKPTYPAAIGLEASKQRCLELKQRALQAITPLGEKGALLRELAHYAIEREH